MCALLKTNVFHFNGGKKKSGESRLCSLVFGCADTNICINLCDCNCFGVCLPNFRSCVWVYVCVCVSSISSSVRDDDWMICIRMCEHRSLNRMTSAAPRLHIVELYSDFHDRERSCVCLCSGKMVQSIAQFHSFSAESAHCLLEMFIRLVQFVRFNIL